MTLAEAIEYFENCGFVADGDRGNEAWAVIKTALAELGTSPNKQITPCSCKQWNQRANTMEGANLHPPISQGRSAALSILACGCWWM